jgi:hypothetical protein
MCSKARRAQSNVFVPGLCGGFDREGEGKSRLLLEAKHSTVRRRTLTGMDRQSRNTHKEIKDYSGPAAKESAIIATACATLRSNEKCWALALYFKTLCFGLVCFAHIVDAFLHRGYEQPF